MKQKMLSLAFLMFIVIASFVGCAATDNPNTMELSVEDSAQYTWENSVDDMLMEENDLELPPNMGGGTEVHAPEEPQTKKIVYHNYLNLETTEYEKTNEDIVALVTKHNGYIQQSSVDGTSIDQGENHRYASYTLRIPEEQAAAFLEAMNKDFHVNQVSNSATDITKSYYDTDSKLKSLQERVVRLEEYIQQAEALEDMLTIEREIASTKAEIDMYYNMLETMKKDISYQTVDISVREVIKVSATSRGNTFGERMKNAFVNSWSNFLSGMENILVGITHNLPGILLLMAVVILFFTIRRRKFPSFLQRKKGKKEQAPPKKDE